MANLGSYSKGRIFLEAVVGLLLLAVSFAAVAASVDSVTDARYYWSLLVAGYAAVTLIADRLYTDHGIVDPASALKIALHWGGVLAALHLAFYFAETGRMANTDIGLTNGLVLGLGAFLAGVHVNWRLMVIGAAVGVATATIAYVEEHLWFLIGIGALAILVLFVGSLLFRGRKPRSTPVAS